jgi:hypothetical protein
MAPTGQRQNKKEHSAMKKILLSSATLIGIFLLTSAAASAQEMKMKATTEPAVAEFKIGTSVQDREIVGEDSTFSMGEKVYAWMKVTGASGDSVVVTWKHADITYSTTVYIGSNSWRTWVYKTMSAAGEWTVTAATTSGDILKRITFTVK